jgi:hypothetical protein
MRLVFASLLLVNLLVFAWGAWLKPAPTVIASAAPAAPRLMLTSEAPPPPPRKCVTVGPFVANDAAAQAAQILLDAGYRTTAWEDIQPVVEGYWVSLASPGAGRAEQQLLQRLRRGGVEEASPILDAILGRRISLGVFSDQERAAAQAARASTVGVEASIIPREREQTVRWLDFQLRTDAPGFAQSRFQVGGAELEFRPCPQAAKQPSGGGGTSAGAPAGEPSAQVDFSPPPP